MSHFLLPKLKKGMQDHHDCKIREMFFGIVDVFHLKLLSFFESQTKRSFIGTHCDFCFSAVKTKVDHLPIVLCFLLFGTKKKGLTWLLWQALNKTI